MTDRQTLTGEITDLKELRNALDAELAKLITLKRDTWVTLNAQIERLEVELKERLRVAYDQNVAEHGAHKSWNPTKAKQ